jgi:hypothetical protein
MSRLVLSAVLVLGLLAVTAPRAQVVDGGPDAAVVPDWMWNFLRWLQGRNGPVSTSMEPREVTLVSRTGSTVRLRVPEAYIDRAGGRWMMENGSEEKPGGGVVLLVYLPGMLPKYAAEQAGYKVHGPGIGGVYLNSEDEVRIDVSPVTPVAWAREIETVKENYTYDRNTEKYAVYYKTIRGSGAPQRYRDVLLPLESEDAIIDCALSQSGERLGCRLSVPQEGPVKLEIGLWSTHLPEWREIVSKARTLVNSLIEVH